MKSRVVKYRNAVSNPIEVKNTSVSDGFPGMVRILMYSDGNPGFRAGETVSYITNGGNVLFSGKIKTQGSGSTISGGVTTPLWVINVEHPYPESISRVMGGTVVSGIPKPVKVVELPVEVEPAYYPKITTAGDGLPESKLASPVPVTVAEPKMAGFLQGNAMWLIAGGIFLYLLSRKS